MSLNSWKNLSSIVMLAIITSHRFGYRVNPGKTWRRPHLGYRSFKIFLQIVTPPSRGGIYVLSHWICTHLHNSQGIKCNWKWHYVTSKDSSKKTLQFLFSNSQSARASNCNNLRPPTGEATCRYSGQKPDELLWTVSNQQSVLSVSHLKFPPQLGLRGLQWQPKTN